jgi:hypothetical protein
MNSKFASEGRKRYQLRIFSEQVSAFVCLVPGRRGTRHLSGLFSILGLFLPQRAIVTKFSQASGIVAPELFSFMVLFEIFESQVGLMESALFSVISKKFYK